MRYNFVTRPGTAGGVERPLKETYRVEASIFFIAIFKLAKISKHFCRLSRLILRLRANEKLPRAAWVLARRTRTAHCRRQPNAKSDSSAYPSRRQG